MTPCYPACLAESTSTEATRSMSFCTLVVITITHSDISRYPGVWLSGLALGEAKIS